MAWIAELDGEPGAYAICYSAEDFKAWMRRETKRGAVVTEVTEQEAIASMKARMLWTKPRNTQSSLQGSKQTSRTHSTEQSTVKQQTPTGA